jgi:hypothetical protein
MFLTSMHMLQTSLQSLIQSMYMHTSVSWLRGKTTLHPVFEQKKYTFLKSYAHACNAPSNTHTLNRTILYSTHTRV